MSKIFDRIARKRAAGTLQRRQPARSAAAPQRRRAPAPAPPREPTPPPAPRSRRRVGPGEPLTTSGQVVRQLLRRHDPRWDEGELVGLDLFSGAGGFLLGAERQGVSAVAVQRWGPAVRSSVGAGHTVASMDVAELGSARVPVDLMIGGPPCQGFSHAGARRGKYDPREGFKLLGPALEASRPRRMVMENVVGFLDPEHRRFREEVFAQLRQHFKHVGVWLLHAKDFGVPQDRSRVFVWGAERELAPPRPTHGPGTGRPYVRPRDVLPHLVSGGFDAIMPFQGGARARSMDDPTHTMTGQRNFYAVIGTDWVYRGAGSIPASKRKILQPEDALIIQSFPDGFELCGTAKDRQKQAGNAVPPPLAAAVVSAMKVGLRPRELTSTELLDAFGSIDESIYVLEPRPEADAALVGVLVDPPYLAGPGIVTVYDGDKLYDQIWEYARNTVKAQAQAGFSGVDMADEQAVQLQAQQYAFGWMGTDKASTYELSAPRVIPMRLMRAAGVSRKKAYETLSGSPDGWWALLIVASLYVGWRDLWRESRGIHKDLRRLEAFLLSHNLEPAEVVQDALSETGSYIGSIAPLEAWSDRQ